MVRRLNNKGFSLVEIIIAVAVFAILVYPISTAIVTAAKTRSTSTKKQYAVEEAEEIMENFKTADLSGDVNLPDDNGTTGYAFTKGASTTQSLKLPDGTSTEYTTTTYTCNDISLGTKYEKYNCEVEVNDAAYQVLKSGYVLEELDDGSGNAVYKTEGSSYVKTNMSSSGTVRNLDSKQSAIITGATYTGAGSTVTENNLDNQAYQYFKDAKLDVLKDYDVQYNQYLAGAAIFDRDSFDKNTTIKISKLGSKYTIECIVTYTDHTQLGVIKSAYEASGNNVYKPTTAYGEGIVYQQEFDGEIPPIYLLYAPAIYNGSYCENDYITVDNSGISEEAKIYLFETTADLDSKYKDVICEQFGISSLSEITYSSATSTRAMSDVNVVLKLAAGADDSLLSIFSNFDVQKTSDTPASDYDVMDTTKDESGDVYMYAITVTVEGSKGTTTITGTRGK
jgi:prepilin-type N-terminal cleavage/methylation domain-containing protein